MSKHLIDTKVLVDVTAYLSTRPWAEANPLIAAIQASAQALQPAPQQPPTAPADSKQSTPPPTEALPQQLSPLEARRQTMKTKGGKVAGAVSVPPPVAAPSAAPEGEKK